MAGGAIQDKAAVSITTMIAAAITGSTIPPALLACELRELVFE